MRWVVVSLIVHATVIVWLARDSESDQLVAWTPPALPAYEHVDLVTTIELVDEPAVAGGGGATTGNRTARASMADGRTRSPGAWEQITVRVDRDDNSDASVLERTGNSGGDRGDGGDGGGTGGGHGGGHGAGRGNGIGFGAGGGVRVADAVPAPPPPPAISKARPAKLVWPNRDEEVEDDANLFVAKVTVDAEGFVIGAHMTKSQPGAKADRAADAIWTFRYAPALDDDGRPVRSTFEQSFQVR